MLISFEGTDAAGKTTQVELLKSIWKKVSSRPLTIADEFSDSAIGDLIRNILLNDRFIRLGLHEPTYFSEFLLLLTDFAVKTEKLIIPKIKLGNIVVADRHIDSPLVYQLQLFSKHYNLNYQQELSKWSLFWFENFPRLPTLTLLFDITAEESFRRIAEREKTELSDYERTTIINSVEAYRWLAKQHSDRYIVINGELSPDEVNSQVAVILKNLI